MSFGEYYHFQETKKLWRFSTRERCGNCLVHFLDPPSHIITPSSQHDLIGLFGAYCSWNCAKRALFDLRTRQWFSLLAITALKLGATLPIVMSDRGKPPQNKIKQIVCRDKIDFFDKTLFYKQSIVIPQLALPLAVINPSANPDGEAESDAEPIAFESVSGIQSDAVMGV